MKILTKSGYSDFQGIKNTGFQETLIIELESKSIEVSLQHRFVVDNNDILQMNLKVGDILETETGKEKITSIMSSYNEVFDVLQTEDSTYYQNGILNHNCDFIGSSHTLLNQKTLENLKSKKHLYVRDSKLKIYEDPLKNEKYILTVDQQKDGSDFFTVSIFKMTRFPFEQVQAQKLEVNYLLMPEYIFEWQESYNYQYVIIENNEGQGQSVQDSLLTEYEYENLHFDINTNSKTRKRKNHPGFRTNRANRPILLSTMKTFIEEEQLIIHDKDLIEEFKHFILINGKYQADDGYHDDLVMGTQFLFVPFIDTKNFDDFGQVLDILFDRNDNQNYDFMDNIIFGEFNQDFDENIVENNPLDF